MRRGILERDAELSVLANAVRAAAGRHGSVALVMGEAGIGKSSLVEALRSHLPAEGRMLVGYCDDLATPRTLGPFRDLVGSVGTELSHAVTDGSDRDRVLAALRAELTWPEHPTVLVIEDVHWADDATLDALRYLIRRIADLPAVLVLTYRDDELNREHPLHGLLGQASRSDHVRHLPLRRLSQQAVRQLSAGSSVDAHDLFALTSGNPFFVHELLASAQGERVPPTIADAVLARVRSLDPSTQDVLEQLAVVPSALERWLVDALVPGTGPAGVAALAAAEERGLLTVSTRRISFRHELTRRAIAGSVPAARLMALNQRVLAALIEHDGSDVSRIVHHAAQAGDQDAIIRYGPAAARDAARAGAHREAVAHFGLVLEHEGRFTPGERAELLAQYAIECYTIGAIDKAIEAERCAVELNRSLGDLRQLGACLRWLSRMYWMAGDRANAEQAGREAIERAGAGRRQPAARARPEQRIPAVHARSPLRREHRVRRARRGAGPRGGRCGDHLARADQHRHLPLASRRSGWPAHPGRGAPGGPGGGRRRGRLPCVREPGLEPARLVPPRRGRALPDCGHEARRGVRVLRLSSPTCRWSGRGWSSPGARGTRPSAPPSAAVERVPAGEMPGADRARPGAGPARAAARPPSCSRRPGSWRCRSTSCSGWARPRPRARRMPGCAETTPGCATSPRRSTRKPGGWVTGCTRRNSATGWPRRGSPSETAGDHPYALQAAGRWREAAALWEAAGCPYEHAAALAESPDPQQLLTALGMLDELGAKPLATVVRRRLRALGVTRIPRGPLGETRVNPAGLTARQIDVLRLLGKGYTNAQIASQLVVSVRTVDSHVAAVLGKLGAASRARGRCPRG